MENYNDKLSSFEARVKNANQKPILQEVKQIEEKKTDEVQLNVWMPKTMLFALKQKALNEETSLKEIIHQAVKNYLV